MLRLTLFGGLRLHDADGRVLGRATRRMQLALLALLASPPGRPVARDKLTAYLWPEKDDERARRSLSTALWELRQELGEDAIRTPGDEVALDGGLFGSDVAEFQAALDRGDLEAATALYAGPFLDGFFLGQAEEFERWVDGERQRYGQAHARALEELAIRRTDSGDARGAVEAWRRLANQDRFSGRIAVGYMTALEAAGDRAAALSHARVYRLLLEEEFGTEPDPAVSALEERLLNDPRPLEPEPRPRPGPPKAADEPPGPRPAPDGPGVGPPPAPRPVASPQPAAPRPRFALEWRVAVPALGVILALALGFLYIRAADEPPWASGAPDEIRLAVLPFSSYSDDPDDEYFAAGLTEDILNALGSLEGFRVPGMSTVFQFRGPDRDLREVGRRLGVDHVVEGSLRREGDALRVVASLVEPRTGDQRWNRTYNVQQEGVLETQEAIARAVVSELAPQLGVAAEPIVPIHTTSEAAQSLYWAGRAIWLTRSFEGFDQSLDYYHRAIQEDSSYALAYAAIADVYTSMGAHEYGLMPPLEAYPLARSAAARALALDPDLPQAHAAMASVLFNHDWNWRAAEAEFETTLELDPGYADARHWYSLMLVIGGRPGEARRHITAARNADPRSPVIGTSLGRHYYFLRDYDRAVREYRNVIALDSTFVLAHMALALALTQQGAHATAIREHRTAQRLLGAPVPAVVALEGHALGMAGRQDAARATLAELDAMAARGAYVPAHYRMLVHLALGETERGTELFRQAYAERSAAILFSIADPLLDPLRGKPVFQEILAEVAPDWAEERRAAAGS